VSKQVCDPQLFQRLRWSWMDCRPDQRSRQHATRHREIIGWRKSGNSADRTRKKEWI